MYDLQYSHYSKKKKIHSQNVLGIYYAKYLNDYSHYDIRIILLQWKQIDFISPTITEKLPRSSKVKASYPFHKINRRAAISGYPININYQDSIFINWALSKLLVTKKNKQNFRNQLIPLAQKWFSTCLLMYKKFHHEVHILK